MAAVFDPYSYSNKAPMDWLERDYESIEQALVRWAELCVANPDKCSLAAKGNNTAEGVHKLVENTFEVAYRNYDGTVWDSIVDNSNSTIMSNPRKWTFIMVAQSLIAGLYDPGYRALNSYVIDSIMAEQATINSTSTPSTLQHRSPSTTFPFKRIFPYSLPSVFAPSTYYPQSTLSMMLHAVVCGDAVDASGKTTEQLFQKIVRTAQTVSRNFAPASTRDSVRLFCHRWTSRAVERLPKKMNIKPKNVVLIIGNTEDPITPYSSAKLLASSAHLGNKARLIRYNTVGHSSCTYLKLTLESHY
jgi:hypothetical protein